MFGFHWLARTLPALVAVLALIGLVGACGSDDSTAPPGAALPADFPLDEVPLMDGTVLTADGKDGVWTVTMQGPANAGNQLDAAVKKLTDAGYTESSRGGDGAERTVTLTSKIGDTTYTVTVGVSPVAAAGSSSVLYQVAAG